MKYTIKAEKVKDSWGETIGYKIGRYYLMKIPTWGNNYEWAINTTGRNHYFQCELREAIDSGELKFVVSYKIGRAAAEALNAQ